MTLAAIAGSIGLHIVVCVQASWRDARDQQCAQAYFLVVTSAALCRWFNQLCPDLKRGPFDPEEDRILTEVRQCARLNRFPTPSHTAVLPQSVRAGSRTADRLRPLNLAQAHAQLGNRWSHIATLLPGRCGRSCSSPVQPSCIWWIAFPDLAGTEKACSSRGYMHA